MQPSTPFVDRESGEFDVDQILEEAEPVARLIGLFVAVALAPLAIAVFAGGVLGGLMILIAQFVLAVGSALTLMYVVVRALQLSGVSPAGTARRTSAGAAANDVPDESADDDTGADETEATSTGTADEDEDANGASGADEDADGASGADEDAEDDGDDADEA